jgi:hypothetical protein
MEEGSLFRSVFGESWALMPAVLRKRYANRPISRDLVLMQGNLTITMAPWLRHFRPLIRLSRALVPFEGDNIPVVIRFSSETLSSACDFDRSFSPPGGGLYRFRSRLTPFHGDEMVEFMAIGIGWRARYRFENGRVQIDHGDYRIPVFGRLVRLPIEWLIGRAEAWEEAIDDNRFRMAMRIQHRYFGELYSYRGEFTVARVEYFD